MTKIVVACASFKGTLSSREAGEALARGLAQAGFQPVVVALADGGEGLVDALAGQISGAQLLDVPCRDPLGRPHFARLAFAPAESGRRARAIIEMAASSGLPLVAEPHRDPKFTTTLGVGDQIRAALNRARHGHGHEEGGTDILLGIGGSATNDGGAGMAQVLGAKLLDSNDIELPPGGAALKDLARIDMSGFDSRIATARITVACDVVNPLCGPRGASAVYGPQKGASDEDVEILDAALAHFAEIIRRDLGRDVKDIPGAGAAGGLGAGCMAFLNATLQPGIDLVLDFLGFDRALEGAALALTGEGFLDGQTLMGKAPAGVASRAKKAGVRCVAIGGGIDPFRREDLSNVFQRIESLSAFAGSESEAMRNGALWLEKMARENAAEWLCC